MYPQKRDDRLFFGDKIIKVKIKAAELALARRFGLKVLEDYLHILLKMKKFV